MLYEDGFEEKFIGHCTTTPLRFTNYYLSCSDKWHPYVGSGFHPTKKIFAKHGELWIDIPFPEECRYQLGFFYGHKKTTLGFELNHWMATCRQLPSEKLPRSARPPVPDFKGLRELAYTKVFNESAGMKSQEWTTLTHIVSYHAWERFEQMCERKGANPLHELMIYTWARPGFISKLEEHQKDFLKTVEPPQVPQFPSPA